MNFDQTDIGTVETTQATWTPRDVILYALGVGAGQVEPTQELQFTTENSHQTELQVLPTFGVAQALARGRQPLLRRLPLARVLHGEQSLICHSPLPTRGTVQVHSKVIGIYDHQSAAHVVTEFTLAEADTGTSLLSTTSTLIVRGEGGFGGERWPGESWERPEGPPDVSVTTETRRDQALLYRLSGDRNPLHSDPVFARAAGFDQPILHGLCTFGIANRLLTNEICSGNANSVTAMAGRFSKPVMPGETLTVSAWGNGNGTGFQYVVCDAQGNVVLDRGVFDVRSDALNAAR